MSEIRQAVQTADEAGAASTTDLETERQLSSILQGLSPEQVVIHTERLRSVAELGQWAGEALTTPQASGAIALLVVVGALALYGLQRLLGSQEDSSR